MRTQLRSKKRVGVSVQKVFQLLVLLVLLACWSLETLAQAYVAPIRWQKALGGSQREEAFDLIATPDGAHVSAGITFSRDGDLAARVELPRGNGDAWVVNVDIAKSIRWQRAFGGPGTDNARAVTLAHGGGYLVVGYSTSPNGDVTIRVPEAQNHGQEDLWVFKLDPAGEILWQKLLGGSSFEQAYDVVPSPDGGYLVVGFTESSDGDLNMTRGMGDAWLLKLDGSGNVQWQKTYGGSRVDRAFSVTALPEGGYVVAGYTQSNDGTVSGNHGQGDFWVFRIDENGAMQWQKLLGGEGDDFANAVKKAPFGDGLVAVGGVNSFNSGDVSNSQGGTDGWVVWMNPSGAVLRTRVLGGALFDNFEDLDFVGADRLIVAGRTSSGLGIPQGGRGGTDAWVVHLDPAGTLLYEAALGGSGDDGANAILHQPGRFVLGGLTTSDDGDVQGHHGNGDAWVLIAAVPIRIDAPLYNCSTGMLSIVTSGGDGATPLEFRIVGLRDWSQNPNFLIPPWQREGVPFVLEVRQLGQGDSRVITSGTGCSPPLPPNRRGLTFQSVSFDCATGRLMVNVTTPLSIPIEYRIVGLRDWASSPVFTVPTWQRDNVTFTIEIRQSTQELIELFTTRCQATARIGAGEPIRMVTRLLPNPADEEVEVEVQGSPGEPIRVELSGTTGQRLYDQQAIAAGSVHRQRIPLRVPSGVYLLKVSIPGRSETLRVVKR